MFVKCDENGCFGLVGIVNFRCWKFLKILLKVSGICESFYFC